MPYHQKYWSPTRCEQGWVWYPQIFWVLVISIPRGNNTSQAWKTGSWWHNFYKFLYQPNQTTLIMMLRTLAIAAALCVSTTEGFAFSPSLSVCILLLSFLNCNNNNISHTCTWHLPSVLYTICCISITLSIATSNTIQTNSLCIS